jgi:hypothetical protein
MSRRAYEQNRRMRRKEQRKNMNRAITPEQEQVFLAFQQLDGIISTLTGLTVKQGVQLADAFGKCARAVDKALEVGMTEKLKSKLDDKEAAERPLTAVPDPDDEAPDEEIKKEEPTIQ